MKFYSKKLKTLYGFVLPHNPINCSFIISLCLLIKLNSGHRWNFWTYPSQLEYFDYKVHSKYHVSFHLFKKTQKNDLSKPIFQNRFVFYFISQPFNFYYWLQSWKHIKSRQKCNENANFTLFLFLTYSISFYFSCFSLQLFLFNTTYTKIYFTFSNAIYIMKYRVHVLQIFIWFLYQLFYYTTFIYHSLLLCVHSYLWSIVCSERFNDVTIDQATNIGWKIFRLF